MPAVFCEALTVLAAQMNRLTSAAAVVRPPISTNLFPAAVRLAVAPTVTGAGKFMISTNAGPHQLAGEMCNEMYFSTSWQNDMTPEAMGKYMTEQGFNDVYLMAPNYAAGKDMLTGFKRTFKGRIADEVYTTVNQPDYQAEIAQLRAKNPTCASSSQSGV